MSKRRWSSACTETKRSAWHSGGDCDAKRQDRGASHTSSGHRAYTIGERNGLRFRVPRPDDLLRQEQRAMLSKPTEIGHFSKDSDSSVRFDRSNLLRYKEPPVGANLLEGIEHYVSTEEQDPDAHPAPIAPILAALEHFQGARSPDKRPHVVTFRNNLNKIMGTPYNTSNEWTMLVERRDGCLYLDVRRTESDKDASCSMHENQRRGTYAGRQFEVLSTHGRVPAADCTSDVGPVGSGDDSGERVVTEGQEYCGLFATTLSGKRLVVAAEIDCFDGEQPTESYVELKTFRVLAREKDTFVFERFKLLAFWIQSFVVGVPKIICGFRSDDFEVCKLQTFATADLPSFGRKYWSPSVCLNFTSSLLDWVLAEVQEGRVYELKYAPRAHVIEMVELPRDASFVPVAEAATAATTAHDEM